MRIGKNDFPDDCPDDCPFIDDLSRHGQNSVCGRCPIFCCRPSEDETGAPFRLVEPDEYREDWSDEWARWFRGGMLGYLDLHIGKKR